MREIHGESAAAVFKDAHALELLDLQLPDKQLLAANLHEFYNLNAPLVDLHQPLTRPRAEKVGKTR